MSTFRLSPTTTSSLPDGIAVFSGGTAANFLVDVFDQVTTRKQCPLRYIIPISDNGGSSSELIRMFGGPSVGDTRSRLVRLIPSPLNSPERTALRSLFEYRLVSDATAARQEWADIVESRHVLWECISSAKRELIRSVLNMLNLEIVKRARPTSVFDFGGASVGNLFLTGARLFSGSFESAIYLLAMICSIPETVSVLPVINSNFTHHIAAGLVDGTQIVGQVAISHPSAPTSLPDISPESQHLPPSHQLQDRTISSQSHLQESFRHTRHNTLDLHDRIEDANLPGSLPTLRGKYTTFSKDALDDDLPSRIQRIWYINPYGHEISPLANPKILEAIRASKVIVYSIGSLYTSIVPSLILKGVGEAIAADEGGKRKKVLVLNATVDRETGPRDQPLSAMEFIEAIAAATSRVQVTGSSSTGRVDARRYVTHLVYIEEAADGGKAREYGMHRVDVDALEKEGFELVSVKGKMLHGDGRKVVRYEEESLRRALEDIMDQ